MHIFSGYRLCDWHGTRASMSHHSIAFMYLKSMIGRIQSPIKQQVTWVGEKLLLTCNFRHISICSTITKLHFKSNFQHNQIATL